MTDQPLDLDAIEAAVRVIRCDQAKFQASTVFVSLGVVVDAALPLVAEVRRLRAKVLELEEAIEEDHWNHMGEDL